MYIRDQIIQILTLARAEMRQVVGPIDADQEIYPAWKIREVLAHIAGWDETITATLEAHAAGEQYTPANFPDVDEFNRGAIEARATLSLEQVTADWQTQRERLLTVLCEMPPERFEQPTLFPWGQVGTVEDVLRGFAAHERRHATEIEAIIA